MVPRAMFRAFAAGRVNTIVSLCNYSSSTSATTSRLPTVAQPSFWSSLVPRFLRKPQTPEEALARSQRPNIPGAAEEKRIGLTFLVLGLLVGSNAINILSLKREMLDFSRQTDAKLELLREVVERVKKGEDVNVKGWLGTGNKAKEEEWEGVMKELENTDVLWEGRQRRAARRKAKEEDKTKAESVQTERQSGPRFVM